MKLPGRCLQLVLVAGLLVCGVLRAEYPQFLLDVTPEEAGELTEKNDYFLKKSLYTAEQHRIVRVDTTLLESTAPFTVTLFNGKSLDVVRDDLSYSLGGQVRRWKGRWVNPPYMFEDYARQAGLPTPGLARYAYDALFGVSVSTCVLEYDAKSGLNWDVVSAEDDFAGYNRAKSAAEIVLSFDGVAAEFTFLDMEETEQAKRVRRYKLRPLDFGGPYHLLTESDTSKMARHPSSGGPGNPEFERRKKARDAYMRALGDDPKTAITSSR